MGQIRSKRGQNWAKGGLSGAKMVKVCKWRPHKAKELKVGLRDKLGQKGANKGSKWVSRVQTWLKKLKVGWLNGLMGQNWPKEFLVGLKRLNWYHQSWAKNYLSAIIKL